MSSEDLSRALTTPNILDAPEERTMRKGLEMLRRFVAITKIKVPAAQVATVANDLLYELTGHVSADSDRFARQFVQSMESLTSSPADKIAMLIIAVVVAAYLLVIYPRVDSMSGPTASEEEAAKRLLGFPTTAMNTPVDAAIGLGYNVRSRMAAATAAAEAAPRVDYGQLFAVIVYPILRILLGAGTVLGGVIGSLRYVARQYGEEVQRGMIAQDRRELARRGITDRVRTLEARMREDKRRREMKAEEKNRELLSEQLRLRKSPGRAASTSTTLNRLLRMKEKVKAKYEAIKPDSRITLTRVLQRAARMDPRSLSAAAAAQQTASASASAGGRHTKPRIMRLLEQ